MLDYLLFHLHGGLTLNGLNYLKYLDCRVMEMATSNSAKIRLISGWKH